MPSPWKHPSTGILWFRVRIPRDVVAKAAGRTVCVPVGPVRRNIVLRDIAKVSLQTRDPAIAKVRFASVLDTLSTFYGSLRDGPVTLNFRQFLAIAGSIYKSLISAHEDNPGDATRWRGMADIFVKATAGDDPSTRVHMAEILVGSYLNDELEARGLEIHEDSRLAVLEEVSIAFAKFLRDAEAMALRDYNLRSFPTEIEVKPPKSAALSFADIIDERVRILSAGRDAKGAHPKTIAKFRRETSLFAKFRGSDDATTVTHAEVSSWIVNLQENPKLGNKTIGDYVTDVSTVCNWGRKQKYSLFPAENPFRYVELPRYEKVPPAERSFRIEEARAILLAARQHPEPRIHLLVFFAAYTGARISELQFLRPEDFRKIEGKWFFRIETNEFRTVKTQYSARTVPVHPALIAEGLLALVDRSERGRPIFRGKDNDTIGSWLSENRLNERPELRASHSFRHLMTDFLTEIGASTRVRLAVMGRASGGSEDGYGGGDVALPGLWRELAKIKPIVPVPAPSPED